MEVQDKTAPTPGENFPQINVYVRMYILYHEHLHISKLLLKIIGAVSLKDASSVSLSVWAEELPATAQTLLRLTCRDAITKTGIKQSLSFKADFGGFCIRCRTKQVLSQLEAETWYELAILFWTTFVIFPCYPRKMLNKK